MKQHTKKFTALLILGGLLTLGQCKVLVVEKTPEAIGNATKLTAQSAPLYPINPAKVSPATICNGGPVNGIIIYGAQGFPIFGVSQKIEFLCQ